MGIARVESGDYLIVGKTDAQGRFETSLAPSTYYVTYKLAHPLVFNVNDSNDVIAARPDCRFLVDSRHRAELYRGAWLKVNAHEAAHFGLLASAALPIGPA